MVGGGKISCSERPKSLCSGELWEGRRWTIEWRERKKTKERPEDSWKGSLIIISRWVSKSAKTETETETGTKFSKFRMHFGELAELQFDLQFDLFTSTKQDIWTRWELRGTVWKGRSDQWRTWSGFRQYRADKSSHSHPIQSHRLSFKFISGWDSNSLLVLKLAEWSVCHHTCDTGNSCADYRQRIGSPQESAYHYDLKHGHTNHNTPTINRTARVWDDLRTVWASSSLP